MVDVVDGRTQTVQTVGQDGLLSYEVGYGSSISAPGPIPEVGEKKACLIIPPPFLLLFTRHQCSGFRETFFSERIKSVMRDSLSSHSTLRTLPALPSPSTPAGISGIVSLAESLSSYARTLTEVGAPDAAYVADSEKSWMLKKRN